MNPAVFFANWKDRFIARHVWLLLPVLFLVTFIPANSTGVTNLFRLLVVLPLLLCIRWVDVASLWASSTGKWFILLCGWMAASLFFDGYAYKDLKLFWRILNLLALFYLVFLCAKYHASKLLQVPDFLLLFGFLGVLLILLDWEGLNYIGAHKNYYRGAGRGVFDHHLEVGWLVGLLGIVSLNQLVNTHGWARTCLYGILLAFFSVVLLVVQARGGYVFFVVGVGLILMCTPGARAQGIVITGVIVLIVCLLLFKETLLNLWENVLDRGASGRDLIWGNGFDAVTASVNNLLFGHGISANAENMVGNFKAAHYHNFFINHTFYTGLIGLILYLGLFLSAVRRAFSSSQTLVWGALILSMQMAFVTDGDRLLVNPSAMMLCFLMPLAISAFAPVNGSQGSLQLFTLLGRRHLAICLLAGLVLLVIIYGLTINV